jgi:hypothetical protein
MRILIPATFAAATLAACTNTQAVAPTSVASMSYLADSRIGTERAEVCGIQPAFAYRETTDRTVIVRASTGQEYLIETDEPCSELAGTLNLAVERERNAKCLSNQQRLVAQSYSGFTAGIPDSGFQSSCKIKAIYEWNEHQLPTEVASLQ